MDSLTYVMALEEIAQGCTNSAMTLHMHNTVQKFISHLCTPEQQARFYPEVVEHGKLFGSWAAERGTSFTRHPFVTVGIYRDGERLPHQWTEDLLHHGRELPLTTWSGVLPKVRRIFPTA